MSDRLTLANVIEDMQRVLTFLLLVLLGLFLNSCSPDKESLVAACKLDAARLYAQVTDNDKMQDDEADYIVTCMDAQGYSQDYSSDDCQPGMPIMVAEEPACYHARSWLGALEMWWNRQNT